MTRSEQIDWLETGFAWFTIWTWHTWRWHFAPVSSCKIRCLQGEKENPAWMQMKPDYRAGVNKVCLNRNLQQLNSSLLLKLKRKYFCLDPRRSPFETHHEDTVLGWLTDGTPPPSIFPSPSLSSAPWLICALLPTSPPLDPILRPCPRVSAVHRQEVTMIYVFVCVFLLCICSLVFSA